MKKQKNRSIKIACLIFAFLLFANMTLFSAGIASPEVSFEIDKNLMDVFEGKVTGIQKEDQPLALDRVIAVQDFSGEEYYVVECAPAGYLIYHPASGIFVETSPSAPSPYRGLSGEHLYYGGPTEYYIEIDGTYYHTVIDEVIETSAKVERMQQACEEMTALLEQNKSIVTLDYVLNGSKTAQATLSRTSASAAQSGLTQEQVDWFKNLSQCGYLDGGVCGFIGLNMIYAFFDKFIDDKYMDDIYWTDSTKTQLKGENESFTKYLYDLDPKSTTTSVHINSVSKQYLEQKGITGIDHTNRIWGLFTKNTIRDILDNGYPVEIFGSLEDPPNYPYGEGKKAGHAVVADQYSGDDFVCHYGWNTYTEVTIVGIFGSIYAMEVE